MILTCLFRQQVQYFSGANPGGEWKRIYGVLVAN